MSQRLPDGSPAIPRWLIWVGSLVIIAHFGIIGVNALAAPSGPWVDNDGGRVGPPLLAAKINEAFGTDYLKVVRLHLVVPYHVLANQLLTAPGVYLEFRLEDEQGNDLGTVKLPDDNANPWVRHRQSLLTQQILWEDQPVTPQQSELIPAAGGVLPTKQYWKMEKGRLELVTVNVNQVPLTPPVSGPNPVSLMLARAYTRYLCRTSGAAKVQVLRHHEDTIRPAVLYAENVQASAFQEVISNFGEFSR